MPQSCINCGAKIGIWSQMPLKLLDGEQLCNDCASLIQNEITALYCAKTFDDFDKIKNHIIEVSKDNYPESICKSIDLLTNKILTESNYIISESIPELYSPETEAIRAAKSMVTTGYDFNGYQIKKYLGIVSGQVVLGTGFLSELSASFADFFGIQSDKFESKIDQAKSAALERMIMKSKVKGGNAIIGVDFDYISFNGNMVGVVATGTSVVVEPEI